MSLVDISADQKEPTFSLSTLVRLLPLRFKTFRFDRHEFAGSLGDLGTFLPLLVGLVFTCGLDLSSALFFAGLFNIITGFIFAIPMAVQPMKAIAAIAITEGLTVNQILAAGIVTGAIIFLFGITDLIGLLNRAIPFSVVRGIQLSVGLQLAITGVKMITGTGHFFGYDSISVGILCGVFVLLLFFSKKFPGALVIFVLGLVFLSLRSPGIWTSLSLKLTFPHLFFPTREDFWTGTIKAAIPQLPLTTLNSVIAVCALSQNLFPATPASPRKVAASVGLMNLVSCWFGAMPMCHGAGGLAGQYSFGARTGGSVIILGTIKMLVAIAFGSASFELLRAYPVSVLGVLLVFSAIELATVTRDIKNRSDFFVMFLTAVVSLAIGSIAIGFVVGLILSYLFFFGVLRIEKIEG